MVLLKIFGTGEHRNSMNNKSMSTIALIEYLCFLECIIMTMTRSE